MTLLVTALGLIACGGVGALLLSRWPRAGSACAVLAIVAGALLGLASAIEILRGGVTSSVERPWAVPYGHLRIGLDPLSAFFLVPVFVLSTLAAVYGRAYLMPRRHVEPTRPIGFAWFAFNVLVASMAVVVVARHAVLFLVAWEVMSLAAYLLVTFDDEHAEVRRAGWIYLIATHVATALLIALFLLLGKHAHSFDFDVMRQASAPSPALCTVLFVLSLVGFGVKAGLVPFHVWLPEAHAAAPSHVSALMSGVLIKMGLYGLLRTLLFLGRPPAWWGAVLILVGLAGGVVGISLALYQRDMKRILAYSSIENMGVIAVGVGTGLWGSASGMPHVAVLGMLGALFHVYNHALMKGLLFLGAGSVLHGSGTKDVERLGGILKRMPRTGTAIVVGAVAIAALPPMNGFVSEWLVYLGLMEGGQAGGNAGVAAFFAVGLLSLVGALAVVCFVRLVGIALLGEPRSEAARDAHESPVAMTAPMGVLAIASIAVAVAPQLPMASCELVVAQILAIDAPFAPSHGTRAIVPVASMSAVNVLIWIAIGLGLAFARLLRRGRPVGQDATWACGYARPSPRMQYTARSFAELLSERLLPRRLRPRISVMAQTGIFAEPRSFVSETSDPLTRGVYEPFVTRWGDRFARLRWVQQGQLNVYFAYILVAALLALAWTSVGTWIGR